MVVLRAVLPHGAPLIDETKVGFVDERRRLQRVPLTLATQVRGGTSPQLLVHERYNAFVCVGCPRRHACRSSVTS